MFDREIVKKFPLKKKFGPKIFGPRQGPRQS